MRWRRRGALIVIGLGTAFLAAGALILTVVLLLARHDLITGAAESTTAQRQLNAVAGRPNPLVAIQPIRLDLVRAHADFHDARQLLWPVEPLLARLGWIPDIGPELASASSVARTADLMLAGAADLFAALTTAIPHVSRDPALSVLLSRLVAKNPLIGRSCRELSEARVSRRAVPPNSDSALQAGLRILDRDLPRLQGLCRTLRVLPSILGYTGARVYLVAYQDSEELRATGGFIGSESVLAVRSGVFRQRFGGSSFLGAGRHPFGAHDVLTIPPPEPVGLYNREPEWLFRDSNWSPNFPTTAQLEAYIFTADTGIGVDGVVDLTPQSSADILAAIGPVYVPAFRVWATAANVVRLTDRLVHPQSASTAPVAPGVDPDTQRKLFIGKLTARILARLRRPTIGMLLRLGQAMQGAFSRGDVLVYFRNPAAESVVRTAGAAGEILPARGDYLYVVDTNLSYNKINPWIHLSSSYRARIRLDRWLDARLTLHLTDAPPAGVRVAGVGPCYGVCGSADDYASYLRVLVPAGAQLVDQRGWTQPWSPGPAYGKTEFAGYLIVPRDRTRTVVLHYVIPPNIFSRSRGKSYSLLIQHQPGSHPDWLRVEVSWHGGHRVYTDVRPSSNRTIKVAIPPRTFDPIPLSRSPATIVSPGHWIEPHAFLRGP